MTACGYCCNYLAHCSKTNHIAIKRAKYGNFLDWYSLKTCDCFLHRAKYVDLQICKDKTFGNLN